MKYQFEVEGKIENCYECPCFYIDTHSWDRCGDCNLLETDVDSKDIDVNCPLKIVEV